MKSILLFILLLTTSCSFIKYRVQLRAEQQKIYNKCIKQTKNYKKCHKESLFKINSFDKAIRSN